MEVVVDFVALGNMEDPYGEELRRRTEGMQLKAEFLGFLEGFEGEWGSMRKKRRIVDASLFGDVLPIGWKLSICIKKQAGRVWLACTRYISPNGQQFVSCKEVSSYLLSFSGLHDVSWLNFGHIDGRIKLTGKITPSIPADHTRKDGKNENDFISYMALPVTCRSIETGGCPVEVQMGNKYKCHKCTVAFDKQDDLLQHLLSHQQAPKRLRFGTSTNEEVIIKNGKYECQFCHKLFEERHRFNGLLGNHIKEYLKRLDASNGKTTGKSDEPALVKIPPGAGKIQTLIEFDRDTDAITVNTKISDEINYTIPYCELKVITSVETHCGKQDRVFINSNDGAGKMNEDTDAVAAENRVSSEPALLNNDVHRSSDETDVPKCPTNGPERDSNSGLLASNAKENTSNDDIIDDRHCSSPIDNMTYGISNSVLEKLEQGRNSGLGFILTLSNPMILTIALKQDADVGTDTVGRNVLNSCLGISPTIPLLKIIPLAPLQWRAVDELKAEKWDSVREVLSVHSGSKPVWSVEKNLQTAFTGSVQEELVNLVVENSENPRMDDSGIGFRQPPLDPDESDVISEFMWRYNDEESNPAIDKEDCLDEYFSTLPLGETCKLFAEKSGATIQVLKGLKLWWLWIRWIGMIQAGTMFLLCVVWCGREICQERSLESEGLYNAPWLLLCAECTAKLSGHLQRIPALYRIHCVVN
ncbi:hypothetical protein NC652_006114 [Populus alba x Populus x berolinensis]|nr:hypothetical protein NC652_006114 [Populus alba x Populus x berolinensis]